MAGLLSLEDEVEIVEFEPHVHEVRMDHALYDLLILAEQNLHWFFALDVLGLFELLEQVFIDCQHFRLGEEKDDLDEDIVNHPQSDLLVVFEHNWSDLYPNEGVYSFLVGEAVWVVRAPSEFHENLVIFLMLCQDPIRWILHEW